MLREGLQALRSFRVGAVELTGSEGALVGGAIASLLAVVLALGLNVRRQRSDVRAGREPKRSDRIWLQIEIVFMLAIVALVIWTLTD